MKEAYISRKFIKQTIAKGYQQITSDYFSFCDLEKHLRNDSLFHKIDFWFSKGEGFDWELIKYYEKVSKSLCGMNTIATTDVEPVS